MGSPGFWIVEWGGAEEKRLEIMTGFDLKDEPLSTLQSSDTVRF